MMTHYRILWRRVAAAGCCLIVAACSIGTLGIVNASERAGQWQVLELDFTCEENYKNPYTEVDFWVNFTHEDGMQIRRPGYWDGGKSFKVRFASPLDHGKWTWRSFSNVSDGGLGEQSGTFDADRSSGDTRFHQHGFWRITRGSRWMQYADGTPAFLVADTPWALPWRTTHQQVEIYAEDRRAKGFNAALLMSVMPDRSFHPMNMLGTAAIL